jgi:hypothetical protein
MVVMNIRKLAVAAAVTMTIAFGVGLGPVHTWAQDDDDEGPMSNMRFVVVRDASGKPVKNAAVVLHPVKKNGKQSMGGLELKTDEDGKTWIDGIPYGTLRVQVLSPGFQTFGEDYEIKQPETQIIVRLKRPTGQYSVYGGVQERDKGKNYGVQEKEKNTSPSKDNASNDGTSKDKKTDPPAQQQPQPPQASPPDQKPQ